MEPRLIGLAGILRLNTNLLLNCLDGLSDQELWRQTTPDTNSVGFLVGHVIDARRFLSERLGRSYEDPVTSALGRAASAEDVRGRFTLAELRDAWRGVSSHLLACLDGATAEQLSQAVSWPFATSDDSLLGGLAFLVQHDSYHLGQVALLRKQLGHGPMSYARSELS